MKSTSGLRLSTRVRFAYGIAAVMWAASLFLPAAEINGSMRLLGRRVFMIGIDALSAGMLGWLANPLLLAAVIAGLLHRYVSATVLAGLACVLASSSFYAPTLARARDLPIDEVSFEVGFFVWLAACSLIFATSAYALMLTRSRNT